MMEINGIMAEAFRKFKKSFPGRNPSHIIVGSWTLREIQTLAGLENSNVKWDNKIRGKLLVSNIPVIWSPDIGSSEVLIVEGA